MGEALRTVLETYIGEFNKIYPNITVEHEQVGSYDDVRDQIKTQINVGEQPNIAYCYPDHVALYNLAGAVQTLDEYINNPEFGFSAEEKADFIQGYYNEGKEFGDGKMYTLPFSKSTEVLYYNADVFSNPDLVAQGLKVPTTWDEMEEACRILKAYDPQSIPLGIDSEANWFITMCEQYGSPYTSSTGDHFLFDNETNHAFVKRLNDWFQKGYITTQTILGSYTSNLFINQPTADNPTRSFMSIGSSAGATHQRPEKGDDGNYLFNVGITSIPQVDVNNPKVISQGPSVCIFKGDAQEVAASWLFVKYLTTSVDFQAAFSLASGYIPVIKSVMQNEIFAGKIAAANGGNNISSLSMKVALEQEAAYYTSPAFNGSSTARDQVGNLVVACVQFTETGAALDAKIKEAFQDAIDECEYAQ